MTSIQIPINIIKMENMGEIINAKKMLDEMLCDSVKGEKIYECRENSEVYFAIMRPIAICSRQYWGLTMLSKKIPVLCENCPRNNHIVEHPECIVKMLREKEKMSTIESYKKRNDTCWAFRQVIIKEILAIEFPETYKTLVLQ